MAEHAYWCGVRHPVVRFACSETPNMSDCPSSSRAPACSIAVELSGRAYVGSFTIDGSIMNVSYETLARSVRFTDSSTDPDFLARHILGELVEETHRRLS